MALGTDGLRGELTLMRAARALAAFEGDAESGDAHLQRVAAPALRHRLRRNPLDDAAPASAGCCGAARRACPRPG
jgi:magnesium chelatase subunit I